MARSLFHGLHVSPALIEGIAEVEAAATSGRWPRSLTGTAVVSRGQCAAAGAAPPPLEGSSVFCLEQVNLQA